MAQLPPWLSAFLTFSVFELKFRIFLLCWPAAEVRSPENFTGPCGTVRWYKPPEGSPEGVPFSEASSRAKRSSAERSERLRRAKRGRPAERSEAPPTRRRGSTERSEAPPRLRRAKRGRAKVIGRSPLQKNSKRFHQKAQAPGEPLIFFSGRWKKKNPHGFRHSQAFSSTSSALHPDIVIEASIVVQSAEWLFVGGVRSSEFRVPEFRVRSCRMHSTGHGTPRPRVATSRL